MSTESTTIVQCYLVIPSERKEQSAWSESRNLAVEGTRFLGSTPFRSE